MHNKSLASALALGLFTLSTLAVTSSALAANYKGSYKGEGSFPASIPAPQVYPCKTLHDGFYAGAAVGYDAYQTNTNTNLTFNGLPMGGNPPVSSMGFVGGIMGGYGIYLGDIYYVGGELLANSSSASSTNTNTNSSSSFIYTTKFSAGTGYGLSFLPGIKVNDSSLFYLRFGYNWTRLKGQESFVVGSASENTSRSGWQGGFNCGLGIETAVYKRISLRGEYTYTSYNSFTSPFGTVWSPSDNQVMLSAIYHFAFLF